MKFSKLLYGLLAVLGIIFLVMTLLGTYLNASDAVSIFTEMPNQFGLYFIFSGISFLTIGIVGITRQYFKNHKNLFTVLAAVFVSRLIFIIMFLHLR